MSALAILIARRSPFPGDTQVIYPVIDGGKGVARGFPVWRLPACPNMLKEIVANNSIRLFPSGCTGRQGQRCRAAKDARAGASCASWGSWGSWALPGHERFIVAAAKSKAVVLKAHPGAQLPTNSLDPGRSDVDPSAAG
jgi:hypothetical protein